MAKTSTISFKNINRALANFLRQGEMEKNRRVLFYLRVYSHLLSSRAFLKSRNPRFKTYLTIVSKLTQKAEFGSERIYIERINAIVRTLLNYAEPNESMRSSIETKILLAQNICILRVLKTAL